MFSWADLATPDLEASQKFYTNLLSLDHEDAPVGNGVVYSMLKKNGKGVCAMYNMVEEMKAVTGGRAVWRAYFTVDNTDETAERARELGASVSAGPMDVFTSGRMALLEDPAGAEFAVWQPIDHIGAGVFAEPGALCWAELATDDADAAGSFYSGLFGWSSPDRAIAVRRRVQPVHGGGSGGPPEWWRSSPSGAACPRTGLSGSTPETWTPRWRRLRPPVPR